MTNVSIYQLALIAVSLFSSFKSSIGANVIPFNHAASYAVLAGQTVTNTDTTGTSVTGDLGVWPGTAITGFPPGMIYGQKQAGTSDAQLAQHDLTTAYMTAANMTPALDISGQNLGGQTLTPGIYKYTSDAQLTGTLTLDARLDPNAVWVFQVVSSMLFNGTVTFLANFGKPENVYWQVGSSATLNEDASVIGSVMALTSISLFHGASIKGRAMARNGAVTLDVNKVYNDQNNLPLRRNLRTTN